MPDSDHLEQAADWDTMWQDLEDTEDPAAEEDTLRWRTQLDLAHRRFGSLAGLKVVEIGAGRATNALMYARAGAHATVLDYAPTALEQAKARFDRYGLPVETIEADVFDLPDDLLGRFDISMSFGLCEHFLAQRRLGVVAAHLHLVRSGGLAIVNVPNKYSPFYRAWMAMAKKRGTWTLGTEVPFSGSEMLTLARAAGGDPLKPVYIGGLGTLINQGPNNLLRRLGRRPLPVPQVQIPGLDLLAYDLLVPIAKP